MVEDDAKLEKELWNTFAEAWLPGRPGGPERRADQGSTSTRGSLGRPGGKVASLLSFAKTKLTGDTYDTDHGVVRP